MQIEHAIPKNVQLRKPVSSACFLCLTRKPINYPIASLFAGAACRAQKFIYFEIYFNWKSELQKEREIFRLLVHSSSGYYIPELDWSTAGSQELLGVPCGCQAPRTWDIFCCLPRPWAKKLDQKWSSQHKWVSSWDAGTPRGGMACYATMLTLLVHFKEYCGTQVTKQMEEDIHVRQDMWHGHALYTAPPYRQSEDKYIFHNVTV